MELNSWRFKFLYIIFAKYYAKYNNLFLESQLNNESISDAQKERRLP
ncbi:MAG: hypothetical protein ACJ702_00730 [Nitrososphaeraceae archaeon]